MLRQKLIKLKNINRFEIAITFKRVVKILKSAIALERLLECDYDSK